MSAKRRIAEKALTPIVAAGAGAAANYVAKKGPGFVEETVLPKLKETVERAGGAAEKLPDRARSAVSGGGDLAEQLTDKARGVVGAESEGGGNAAESRSTKEMSQRREERAKSRAKRRKATRK
jgi:hypothetical protein